MVHFKKHQRQWRYRSLTVNLFVAGLVAILMVGDAYAQLPDPTDVTINSHSGWASLQVAASGEAAAAPEPAAAPAPSFDDDPVRLGARGSFGVMTLFPFTGDAVFLMQPTPAASALQRWSFRDCTQTPIPPSVICQTLSPAEAPDYCLAGDLASGEGGLLQIVPCHRDDTSQAWRILTNEANPRYRFLINLETGMAATFDGTAIDTPIRQRNFTRSFNQQFDRTAA